MVAAHKKGNVHFATREGLRHSDAEQYRQLGIPRFAELYVLGFLSGGEYDGIPLEVNAYDLGGRFERSPQTRFSVADEVGMGT